MYINLYFYRKSPTDAKNYFAEVLSKYPEEPQILFLAGVTDYRLGDKQNAMSKVMKAYTLSNNPEYLKAYTQMEQDIKIEEN